ncbi:hypothetical protein HYE60_10970 [Aggregatibacter actinomycetemcomitans]|uniref:hypothetical protein n=1 Tax=Aggregatibacter actinomycetemcomitans TaxID=714 RepID=UPI00197B58E2|nr:hypothetical protein [Aggregatibacter actinomycetemcomitans]MBN6075755.1 hypothetical protein [Aggregatibacter actinomycetemcomitans]
MKIRRGSVWDFDNPDDYYDQFEEQPQAESEDDESDDCDGDCEYWESGCYGRG